jgi:hypothetical protein
MMNLPSSFRHNGEYNKYCVWSLIEVYKECHDRHYQNPFWITIQEDEILTVLAKLGLNQRRLSEYSWKRRGEEIREEKRRDPKVSLWWVHWQQVNVSGNQFCNLWPPAGVASWFWSGHLIKLVCSSRCTGLESRKVWKRSCSLAHLHPPQTLLAHDTSSSYPIWSWYNLVK